MKTPTQQLGNKSSTWTEVTKNRKNKGKHVFESDKLNTIDEINGHNGFETLGVWDDPGVNNPIGLRLSHGMLGG